MKPAKKAVKPPRPKPFPTVEPFPLSEVVGPPPPKPPRGKFVALELERLPPDDQSQCGWCQKWNGRMELGVWHRVVDNDSWAIDWGDGRLEPIPGRYCSRACAAQAAKVRGREP